LLLPFKRRKEAEEILIKEKLFIQKQIVVSTSILRPPFRVMLKGGKVPVVIEEKKIFINNGGTSYSDEFMGLLKDYYLYL
jgi:hypothetical protein